MKYIHGLILLLIATCGGISATAQCTGNCAAGSISMPTGSATLTAGSIYCVTTPTNLSGNAYTISGTLIVQSGTLTLGNVTLDKTGVILVKNGAKLIITGILTGNSIAPVSTIDNIIICSGGLLNITGSFSQGQINIAVSDFGAMNVTGAWTAGATASTVKIGNGAVIELCSSFNLNKDGFFVETSSGDSYLVTHASMIQSVTNGFLSTLKNASHIKWTADAPAAFVSHPAAYTCNGCGNYNLAPPGTNSTCGSAANALYNTPLSYTGGDKPVLKPTDENNDKVAIYPNPANKYLYLQLPKKNTYTHLSIFTQAGQLVYQTIVKTGSAPARYDLPAIPVGIYFVQLTGNESSLTLRMAKE